MALINIPTDHIKLRKTLSIEKKPLMLKDYLRDDLGSCSSSGFKSFPRRQCCTTIRFLLEADLKKSRDNNNYSTATKRLLKRRRSKPGSAAKSALQRASGAVLNAVKLLSFPSVKSSSPSSLQGNSSWKGHLPRSFSKKLFKRGFWIKADKEDNEGEIKRWKLFRKFLQEKNQPSDQNNITGYSATDTCSTFVTSRSSYSWAESEFTANNLQSSSGNSKSLSLDDAVLSERDLPEKKNVSNLVGVTAGEDSINPTKAGREEGNEQFSPVSVLDCPFDEEEEEDNGSVFEDRLARVEGTKQKLMQKIRRFERLAQLEPVDLEQRIAMTELEDESEIPSNRFVPLKNVIMMKNPREIGVEWEVNEGIKAYVNEMEKNDNNWIKFNDEKEEVGSLLEVEVFSSLVDELFFN